MLQGKTRTVALVFVITLITSSLWGKSSLIHQNGYDGCIELTNGDTRVVLEPNCGGRVLIYAYKGVNVIQIDPAQNGWEYDPQTGKRVSLCAGRCDVGFGLPFHPTLWFGRYQAEITGPFSARLTSQEDRAVNIQLVREFVLDAETSHLRFTQTIKNIGPEAQRLGHWGRTFAVGNGIALVPLNPKSRFRSGYITTGPNQILFHRLKEPPENCRIRDGIFEIYGPPPNAKFFFDPAIGWLAYITPTHRLFLKRYHIDLNLPYGDDVASTASYWYNKDEVCEIEPMGPYLRIPPGQSRSFTEHWYLYDFECPPHRRIDLSKLQTIIRETDRCDGMTVAQ